MSPFKKKKAQGKPVNETPLAPRGAYEGESGLYGGGPSHQSLKEEIHAHSNREREDRVNRQHGVKHSQNKRPEIEERQVIPLLFLFKWAVLGVVGLVLVLALKMFLGGYNKDAAKEILDLQAQVKTLTREKIERPTLAVESSAEIATLIAQWRSAEDHARAALDLMRWDRRDEASRRLSEALVAVPNHQPSLVLLSQIAFKNKEHLRSVNLLRYALSAEPSRLDLRLMLAQSLQALGEDRSALLAAEWMLDAEALNLDALTIASQSAVELAEWDAALVYFEKILVTDRNNLEALRGASTLYFRDNKYAKALPYLERLMDVEDTDWNHFFQAAVCQSQLSRSDEVVRTLELASVKFNEMQVYGWTGSSLFDPVRESNIFVGFQQRVALIAQRGARRKIEEEAKPAFAPVGPAVPNLDLLKK
jgi:tetratricopeptide (TPR) repeat protein